MWQLFSISILVNSRPKEDLLFDRTYSQYMITVLLLYEMIYIYVIVKYLLNISLFVTKLASVENVKYLNVYFNIHKSLPVKQLSNRQACYSAKWPNLENFKIYLC